MRVVYSPRYHVDIGLHVYPTTKYQKVHAQLLEYRLITPDALVEPEIVSWDDLALVHTQDYLRKLRCGELSLTELARLEIPWSEAITDGFRLMSGGTLTAAREAVAHGLAAHIGGGFHHAYAGHGEGFCMFNDVALAIRVLQRGNIVSRAAVDDCDVHHGNGTAAIFESDPTVFTFSMHQSSNYPMDKPPSTLDIGIGDQTGDEEYLRRLAESLPSVMADRPDILFYLAGADPYERDQLGGLALTKDGLATRDRLVLGTARQAAVPIVVTLAGGYAYDLSDTVDIHVTTIEETMRDSARRIGT